MRSKLQSGGLTLALAAAAWQVLNLAGLPAAMAQVRTASLQGTVRDVSGSPIAGAEVIAQERKTGRNQTARTNSDGAYEFPELVPGTYELQAAMAGFASARPEPVQAEGATTHDLVLSRSSRFQAATGRAAEASSPSERINEAQLVGLPLNGRSYTQLATLQAGVSDPASSSGSRGVGGGNLTVVGGRAASNSFLLDGTSIMDTNNRVPRSAAGVQLGSDAVLQVQVFTLNAGAEFGRGSGGVLNSITRSGSAQMHGTLFEYFRNSKLDARDFFDLERLPFKRNQFGFTLTGPISKKRTFFLGAFEAMRDRLSATDYSLFPDLESRRGDIYSPDGVLIDHIDVAPRAAPYVALYPLPNGGRVGNGIGENRAGQFLPTDENYFAVRIDHQITERDSLFARYNFDNASSQSGQGTYLYSTLTRSRQQYASLVGSHIFSARMLTSFRLSYTRPTESVQALTIANVSPALYFVSDAPQFGEILFPGGATMGPSPTMPEASKMNTFQFSGDMIGQKGRNSWKTGFEVHRYRWDLYSSLNRGAVWSFNSLESFLQGGPEGTTLTVALPGSDNRQEYRQTLVAFHAQDAISVTPRLQFQLGLRYEMATLIHDKHDKTAALANPFRDSAVQVGPLLDHNPSLRNFSPRVGITWSPWGRSTVLSSSFGIFYDPLLAFVVKEERNTLPFYRMAVRTNFDSSCKSALSTCSFPDATAAAVGVPLQAQTLDSKNLRSPTVLRYSASIQQQIGTGWTGQISYVGSRGNHLFRSYEINLFPVPLTLSDGSLYFPPNLGPTNPAFGSGTLMASDAQAFYNSLQLTASKSLSHGLSLQASYTFSKSVDDASVHTSGSAQYGLQRTLDRGLSDFDIRNRVSLNYFYNLPSGAGVPFLQTRGLRQLIGGWRVGGIISFRNGIPFTPLVNVRTPGYLFAPTRPNLLPGRSNNPILGKREKYFDPSAFSVPPPGTLGNLGRNTVIAPSVFTMDLSLQKEFSFGKRLRMQFRTDIFNLPNHTNLNRNVAGSGTVFTGAAGRPNPSAGRIGTTVTNPRQMQFALRLSF